MDWRLVVSTFLAVFLGEMGDKTQIAAVTFAASSQRPLSVFAGASTALVVATVLNVFVGTLFSEVLPVSYLRRLGGAVFIILGVAMSLDWL
ncbi:MAG: TMEM165/GDT1 family protein [Candidatus Binatia bacterium]|jgi:Ca2+/H+ antiporter, TMEM165/GDT1 family